MNLNKACPKYLFLIVLCLVLSIMGNSCGRASFDRKIHKVTKIENGNTIILNNRVSVQLIGVYNSPESKKYLTENVLGQNVRVRFDRSKRESVSNAGSFSIYAYVITQDRISINAEIIRRNYSQINNLHLTDSLDAFTNYSKGLPYDPRQQRSREASDGRSRRSSPRQRAERDIAERTEKDNNTHSIGSGLHTNGNTSFTQIVSHVEKTVFLIYSLDQNGNRIGLGTGFFIDKSGIGLSNHHVLDGGSRWIVKTFDQETYEITEILKESIPHDYVKFNINNKSPVKYLNIETKIPKKGDDVFVLGNPRGLESTLSRGIVSALRSFSKENDIIQIDAAISPGSSGSPVMTMDGNVIGIATKKKIDCERCNFAVNIRMVFPEL